MEIVERKTIKAEAKEQLNGKWGVSIGVILIYALISGITTSIFGAGLILSGPLALGLAAFFLNIKRKTDPTLSDLFTGFDIFPKAFGAAFFTCLFTLLWSLLLIVPGIVKAYAYSMTYFILRDNPGSRGIDALTASKIMTQGHKGEIFVITLSFLGWFILSIATGGILFIYTGPYFLSTMANYYDRLKEHHSQNLAQAPV